MTGPERWEISICKCGALSTGHASPNPNHGFSHNVTVVSAEPADALAEAVETWKHELFHDHERYPEARAVVDALTRYREATR